MILLLDVGNTRIKWAFLQGNTFRSGGATLHGGDVDQATRGWTETPRPQSVAAVSVASPVLNERISQWIAQAWGLDMYWLRSGEGAPGMVTCYTDPSRLGADRWAVSVGAFRHSEAAVCVVDCGSAITFDGVDANGRHLGGLIIPGWRLMCAALHKGTAALPFVEADTVSVLATDTVTAIGSGTMLGAAAMIDTLSQRIVDEMGGKVDLWLTGGDAPVLLPHLQGDFRHEPDLVLQGVAAMAAMP